MSILTKSSKVSRPIPEGNYEMNLTKIQEFENTQGGYVQLTLKNAEFEVIYNIFGSNEEQIKYLIQTLGQQVGVYGDEVTLNDVLVIGFVYKVYVHYNEYGRNISFGVRRTATAEIDNIPEPTTEENSTNF